MDMSKHDVDDSFWDRADRFINQANDFCDHAPRDKVSASLLYAAARFNAFVVSATAETMEELQQDKDAALEYFVGQYRKMLEENLDDHIANFNEYSEDGNS